MEYVFKKGFRKALHLTLPPDENGKEVRLTLNPPKLKMIRKLSNPGDDVDSLVEMVAAILSTNTDSKKFGVDDVEELFDLDQMVELLEVYSQFIQSIQNSKN